MADRGYGEHSHTKERYAEDMNSDIGRRDWSPREFGPSWSSPHYRSDPQRTPKTKTSPVVTRTNIARHGSHREPPRPSSSGENAVLPYRHLPPPRRAESYSHPTPLDEIPPSSRSSRQWPPWRYMNEQFLSPKDAEALICTGASLFKGILERVPHDPSGSYRYYAVMDTANDSRTDRASSRHSVFRDISLNMTGQPDDPFPWISLEKPSMAFAFGRIPGTTTLNFWVGKHGGVNPPVKYAGNAKPKKLKLLQILERLAHLQEGLEIDNPEDLYEYLYGTLIEDPDKKHPHYRLDQQITDLITVLTNDRWIDFTNPKNQVVAKYFDSSDNNKKQGFFHQLLLSVELYLRIHCKEHTEKAKKKLLTQLPPIIAWDLAVAQRWLENMLITKSRTSSHQSTFSFELKQKQRQKEALRVFAETLKWPNMDEIDYVLDEKDEREKALEDRSADAMSFFSGIILPGRTLPWLIMNSLIDCDRDTGEALAYLSHMHPASGFQYRGNTFWSYESIVGKVLSAARGVNQVAGWIGPCIYTPDLKRSECVRVRQRDALDPKLSPIDVESMGTRTHPLGEEAEAYPVVDYDLPEPETEDVTDAIRVEKLCFLPAKEQPSSSRYGPGAPLFFDAAIKFACGGHSWNMSLKYNVDFVSAFPCQQGPHVLFYDFEYKTLKVDDDLVGLEDWGEQCGRIARPASPVESGSSRKSLALTLTNGESELAHMQVKKVLVIEALGVSDNEVFARAWCAHHGHSALVANIKETCMACAIREAHAACISVVILTEGGKREEKDTGVYG